MSDYIGGDDTSGAQVSIIDLSFVPTEVIHVVTAVVARMVFESLQRYRVLNGQSLPTVLVMEEAHRSFGATEMTSRTKMEQRRVAKSSSESLAKAGSSGSVWSLVSETF